MPTLCVDSDTELSCISSLAVEKNLVDEREKRKTEESEGESKEDTENEEQNEEQKEEEAGMVRQEKEHTVVAAQFIQQQHQQLVELQEQVSIICCASL